MMVISANIVFTDIVDFEPNYRLKIWFFYLIDHILLCACHCTMYIHDIHRRRHILSLCRINLRGWCQRDCTTVPIVLHRSGVWCSPQNLSSYNHLAWRVYRVRGLIGVVGATLAVLLSFVDECIRRHRRHRGRCLWNVIDHWCACATMKCVYGAYFIFSRAHHHHHHHKQQHRPYPNCI